MGATPKIGYGGQAVLEGVMMRGRRHMAVAVRAPDKSIVLHSEALPRHLYDGVISRIPLVRGVSMLWDSLVLGLAALTFAAEIQMRDENGQSPREREGSGFNTKVATWGSVVIALIFGIGLFFVLPLVVVGFYEQQVTPSFWSHLVEGVIRLAILIAYVGLIGFTPEIRRVYQYHGAEHMTIHAFEHDDPLNVQAITKYPTAHPRCGTAFLMLVVAVSVLVFAVVGTPDITTRILSRIVLIPVIAGIAYEILKFGGKYYEKNLLVRLLVAPGLLLQAITTKRPEPDMIEVAIASFEKVRSLEEASLAPAQVPPIAATAGNTRGSA
jgi:uncharacterized protein YqhQ